MEFEDLLLPTPKYATAAQIAQQRRIAQLLMDRGQEETKLTHPLQVFGNLANNALGAHQFNQANDLGRASSLQDATNFAEGTTDAQGGISSALGLGGGGESPALGYAATGNVTAAAPKFSSPPVPGGPVTRAPLDGVPEGGNMLPSGNVPHRVGMTKKGLINTLASDWLDPGLKQAALKLYLEQTQPLQIETPGGTMSIDPVTGRQVIIPKLFQEKLKSGDTEFPVGVTYDWKPGKGVIQNFVPTGGGGGVPASGGPLNTSPPGGNIIPDQMRAVSDYSQDQHARKQFTDNDQKELFRKHQEALLTAEKAQKNLPQLGYLRQMIEDPKLYQGIGSDIVLDLNRLGAALGFKGGEKAASLMQAFDKTVSGNIVADLTTQLQGTGQIRVAEIELLRKAAANRHNTLPANRAILELMMKANDQMVGLANVTADYMAAHRHNATTAGLHQAKVEWLKKNPMLSPEEIKEYAKKFEENPKYPPPAAEGGKNKRQRTQASPLNTAPPPAWSGGTGDPPPTWTIVK